MRRRRPALPHERARRRAAPWMAAVGAAAVLAVALATVTVTAASHQDRAHVNVGSEGIGSAHPFDLVLVDGAGVVHDASPGAPLSLEVPGADALVPGRSVEIVVQVANNHPTIAAAVSATLTAEPVAGTPDITPFLRYSVIDADGSSMIGGSVEDPAAGLVSGEVGDLGVLLPRGAAPLDDGSGWTPGADGSSREVTVLVHMVDDPATGAVNGGRADLALQLDAMSVDT